MATLKDIADIVGVSVPTVSKILNNKSQKCASEKTQDQVWQAVRDIGYTPNIHARKVASSSAVTKVNIIAICMCQEQEPFFANYYRGVLEKLEMQIISHNYIPYTCEMEELIEGKSPLMGQKVVGLVLIGEPSAKTLAKASRMISNFVVLSLENGLLNCDKVFCSFKDAMYKIMKKVHDGQKTMRRQICFVGGNGSSAFLFFQEYMKNHRIDIAQTVFSDYTVSGGYVGGMQLAQTCRVPVAVICEGYRIASGVQKAFWSKKISMKNSSFFVMDDCSGNAAELMYESVYVDLASKECTAQALSLLIDRIRHQHKIAVVYEIDSQMFSVSTVSAGGV